jgi:hypothetical protein
LLSEDFNYLSIIHKDDLEGKNAYEHYKKKLIYNGSKVDGEYAETYHSVFHII